MPRQFKTVALWGRLGERSVTEPARQVVAHLRKRGITVLASITSDPTRELEDAIAIGRSAGQQHTIPGSVGETSGTFDSARGVALIWEVQPNVYKPAGERNRAIAKLYRRHRNWHLATLTAAIEWLLTQRCAVFILRGSALAIAHEVNPQKPVSETIVALHDLGFLNDPQKVDAELLMDHVRAVGGWYMEDREVTIDSTRVMEAIAAVSDPRSSFYRVMRRENLPANELMGRRMESGVLAVLGQLQAPRNWYRFGREWWFGDTPSAEFRRVFNLVHDAQTAAMELGRPNVTECQALDRAARKVIGDAGYGPSFTHRLGHGMGMDGHEVPYLVEGNTLKLEPGMVFSIEPGVYQLGKFGVRIEDDCVMTEGGIEVLSSRPARL